MGMRPSESSAGVIMGASQIAGVNAVAPWLLLQDKTGIPFGFTYAAAGVYQFAGLLPGEYAAVMLDPAGGYRGKVAHTVVPYPPINILTTSLPSAEVGVAYSVQLTAEQGLPPYEWLLDSGTLPTGLTLTTGGLLSGTPTTVTAASDITVSAEGPIGNIDYKTLSIEVVAAADFIGVVEATSNLTWFCIHEEASGTTAENRVGADGTYVGTPVFAAAAIYTGGGPCWDTDGDSFVDIPAGIMPSTTASMTLGILMKSKTPGGIQALIDRDEESAGSSIRKWQWRLNGTNMDGIDIVGGVESITETGAIGSNETALFHFRVNAGSATLLKNGVVVEGPATWGGADYGSAAAGLRIARRLQGDSQANIFISATMVWRAALSDAECLEQAEEAGLA